MQLTAPILQPPLCRQPANPNAQQNLRFPGQVGMEPKQHVTIPFSQLGAHATTPEELDEPEDDEEDELLDEESMQLPLTQIVSGVQVDLLVQLLFMQTPSKQFEISE